MRATAWILGAALAATPLLAAAELRYQPGIQDPSAQMQATQRAQAQDTTRSPDQAARRPIRTQQDRFEDSLRRAIISEITRGVRREMGLLDEDGRLQPLDNPISVGNFEVDIFEREDGRMVIVTRDPLTGERSEFSVGF